MAKKQEKQGQQGQHEPHGQQEEKPQYPRATEIQTLMKIHEALKKELIGYRHPEDSRNKSKKNRKEAIAKRENAQAEGNESQDNMITTRNSWQDIADFLERASEEEGIKYPTSKGRIYEYLRRFEDDFGVEFECYNTPKGYENFTREQKRKVQKIYKYPKGFKNEAFLDYIGEQLAGGSDEIRKYLDEIEDDSMLGVWTRIFINNLTKRSRLVKSVSFYENIESVVSNHEKFETIIQAIIDKQPLEVHNKYDRRGQVKIQPYLLKNYNQRWYLIGKRWNEEPREGHPDRYYEGYAVIALDVMEDVKSENGETIIPAIQNWEVAYVEPDAEELNEYFDEMVGVTTSKDGPEDVYLRFEEKRYKKYVATKPIVRTQSGPVREGSEYYDPERPTIHLKAHITKELVQQILSFGPDCEVVAPGKLRDEIKTQIETMKGMY